MLVLNLNKAWWRMIWSTQLVQLGSVQLAYPSFSDVGRYSFQIGERDSRELELSSLNSECEL